MSQPQAPLPFPVERLSVEEIDALPLSDLSDLQLVHMARLQLSHEQQSQLRRWLAQLDEHATPTIQRRADQLMELADKYMLARSKALVEMKHRGMDYTTYLSPTWQDEV